MTPFARTLLALAFLAAAGRGAAAQESAITRVDLSSGRSYPITTASAITRVSVADTGVADVVVVSPREMVINGRRSGEVDAIVWLASGAREHYRVQVRSAADRMQIVLYVKFAEVRRDLLNQLGASIFYLGPNVTVGTGAGSSNTNIISDPATGQPRGFRTSDAGEFISVLTDWGTDRLLTMIQAEQTRGTARLLAEPNLMAGNRDTASFLAGGELPIPIVQGAGLAGGQSVTIVYREFGVRLKFVGEIISDSLLRLAVAPEVSSLDYTNAVVLQGFRIPALRTRRMQSTLDVRRNQALVISGMFNNEMEKVKTGVPLLMDVPILGQLFSSTRFQRNETELLIVVKPVIVDPMRPRPQDVVRTPPDTIVPAVDALRRPGDHADRPALPAPRKP